jgi:uncharacterized protein YndB with AHSA1/START domain
MTVTAHAAAVIAADPDAVFAALTDVAALPSWNARMTAVVECPTELTPGSEWVVEFRVFGRSWRSRSTLEALDRSARRFVHTSRTDDGNPSYARWEWRVEPDAAGSRVEVTWSLHPVTFWRRVLLVRVRARQLAGGELPASLAALANHVAGADARS